MIAVIRDPRLQERLIAERRKSGGDKHDEVWEGTYVMAPLPNNEHQQLVADLTTILTLVIAWPGLGNVAPGANVSDRRHGWEQNFRCPDIVVFLNDTKAENCDTFWYGGPDFVIEIVSPEDQTLDKLPFFAKIGTRELLVVDRDPWQLTLYRLHGDQLVSAGTSTPENATKLINKMVPLTFALARGDESSVFVIELNDGTRRWEI